MAAKAVFLDRDDTLIEDPGYLSDPAQVKLLPGVELAIRSLHEAGFRIVVVTNQSGIARGMLTEETLERIHAEMRRQLAAKGVHVDAIYYCPFHPEGTVEKYAIESDLRKPRPGMLLKAAQDLGLELPLSWMVGDSPRDMEAGQRAGCRTIRVRSKAPSAATPGEQKDENVQADFTVRNLVDAARIILRDQAGQGKGPAREKAGKVSEASVALPSAPGEPAPSTPPPAPASELAPPEDPKVLLEILGYVRQLARAQTRDEFNPVKMLAGTAQAAALAAVIAALWLMGTSLDQAKICVGLAAVFQGMSLTLYVMNRLR